ncbi:MAG: hypothetical protein AB1733_09130 [Thermodesulfobacteriota bacterium]
MFFGRELAAVAVVAVESCSGARTAFAHDRFAAQFMNCDMGIKRKRDSGANFP